MTEKLLRKKDVLALIGLSKATLHRLVQSGEFPKPIQLTKRAIAWPESVVEKWIDAKKNEAI
jgi:prophage regulatory protein